MKTWVFLFLAGAGWAQGDCPEMAITSARDYSSVSVSAGSAAAGSYRWLVNGAPVDAGAAPQLALLHADGSPNTTSGVEPASTSGIQYPPGRWGAAIALDAGASLNYPRAGNLNLSEGTLEMWVALRGGGRDDTYVTSSHTLFRYSAANGDWIGIQQAGGPNGIVYGGGTVNGQWQSAWGTAADMRDWAAGEWHHLAFTWSASANHMKMFVDGVLVADTNEGRYVAPATTGASFLLGDPGYLMDEVRISGVALPAEVILADALRSTAFSDNEVTLLLASRAPGDQIAFEWTTSQGGFCRSATYVYPGLPISAADPPSTILAPGSTSLALTVQTPDADTCRYSVGGPSAYEQMQPLSVGDRTTVHQGTVTGLNPDPSVVNHVFVRCASHPDYALELLYRARSSGNARYPRTGNLWGSSLLIQPGLEHAARIDLYLGAFFTPAQVRKLRALNPNILILTSINTVENSNLPEDYYLHTVEKKRIEVWPGTYRLNLTKPNVAEYQAKLAYQLVLDSGLLIDGCFFDNFFTSQSWQDHDIYGNAAVLDADEDGKPDDPAVLDAKWREGVFRELRAWRKYMPYALNSGHLPRPPDADTLEVFNGDSIGFMVPQAKDGSIGFYQLFDLYNNWFATGRKPVTMMLEAAPPYQIGYGYGYDPMKDAPAAVWDFARTYYPYMRFGLATTLMNDGYFAHEFGDTFHGNDWWYDELDFDLGYPLGPAVPLAVGQASGANLVQDGDFSQPLTGTWDLWVNTDVGARATVSIDGGVARVDVTSAGQGVDWHIDLHQYDRHLVQGTTYTLTFRAKADIPRPLSFSASKESPDWRNYGLYGVVNLGTGWQTYSVKFDATATVADARLQFFFGASTGTVWLDDVVVTEALPAVYRRDFTNGIALLNGSRQRQAIDVGPGYQRISGTQAARYEYILDDADASVFSAAANWSETTYDSGMWKETGPYYHNWGQGCHQCSGAACGQASWDLQISADDNYTIAAWWPAAPLASSFSRNAVFEVVANGKVVASVTVDQTRDGDQWHTLFTAPLKAADRPFVRVRGGSGIMIADALWVRSAARYNDGSPASSVTLEPMDGIILRRSGDHPSVGDGGVVDAAGFSSPIARGSWASVFGARLATATRLWTGADFHGTEMPVTLDGTGVKVNGVDAPVSFVSPAQVNFQVPSNVETGPAIVQVTAPEGESNPALVQVTDAAPAFFTLTSGGKLYAIAQSADGATIGSPGLPAVGAGDVIVLWGSGFGATNPPTSSGTVLAQPAALADISSLRVTIGGLDAPVAYAGTTIAGVYQINVQVPSGLASGPQPLSARLAELATQAGVLLLVR